MTHAFLAAGLLLPAHGTCPHCGLLRCPCATLGLERAGHA